MAPFHLGNEIHSTVGSNFGGQGFAALLVGSHEMGISGEKTEEVKHIVSMLSLPSLCFPLLMEE